MSSLLALTILVLLFQCQARPKLPNIMIILVDDLGFNDIPWNYGSDFDLPNTMKMAINESLILDNYYVNQKCTPTRTSLMSGRYPASLGMQNTLIAPSFPWGLPLDTILLPQQLQNIGYSTHMVGKWHLGFCNESYTPNGRGFDHFFGYFNGEEDYYTHNFTSHGQNGFDLRNNSEPVTNLNTSYSTYFYGNETLRILQEYHESNQSKPLFLYVPFQAIHWPLEAPQYIIDRFDYIQDPNRTILAAISTVLDESLGIIFDKLLTDFKEIWDNMLLIYSTDNGGEDGDGSSNYPLRGQKFTLWEGGVHGVGFVSGGLLNETRRGQRSKELIHVSDWYPTVMDLIGIKPTNESVMDGYSMLEVIQNGNVNSSRHEILHDLAPVDCIKHTSLNICGGLRMDDWKIVVGPQVMGHNKGRHCDAGWCKKVNNDTNFNNSVVQCGHSQIALNYSSCPYDGTACLYNIANDPCEYFDVKDKFPEQYNKMMNRLLYYNSTQAIPLTTIYAPNYTASNPDNFGGYWTPWLIHNSNK